jgi:hypothetical protein
MEHVELSGGAFLTRITACHVTTYYHVSPSLSVSRLAGFLRRAVLTLAIRSDARTWPSDGGPTRSRRSSRS